MNSFNRNMKFVDTNGETYPEWEQKKLGEVADLYQPQTISGKDLKTEGYPVYGANGKIGFYDKYNHESEQVTVTCRGNTCGTLNYTVPFSWITGNAMVINPFVGQATKRFLYYCMESIDFDYVVTGSGQPQITRDPLASVSIPLPSLPEQEKIAEFFGALDERIALTADRVRLLKEQKKGYLQQVLNRELVFTDDNGEQYPEWEQKKLGEAVDIVGGGTPTTSNSSFWNGNINWFSPAEIGDSKYLFDSLKKITEEGLKNSSAKLLPKGTILLSTRASVGKLGILGEEGTASQSFEALVPLEGIDSEYLYCLGPKLKEYCQSKSAGSTFKGINKHELSKMSLPVPSLSEQRKIAEFFGALDERIVLTENKLALLKEQKKGYLQGIFG